MSPKPSPSSARPWLRAPVSRGTCALLGAATGISLLAAAAAGQEPGRTPLLRPERAPVSLATPVEAGVRVSTSPRELTTRFEDGGVEIQPAPGAPALRLSLAAWGRSKARAALHTAGPTTRGHRVEYRRGAVTEWFVESRLGLQQGFTVEAPPAGAPGDGLGLELDLGGWRAEVLPGGRDAELVDASGAWRLSYGGLLAWDANHVALDAVLVAGECTLTIQVDDRGAAYPLTIDPWITTSLTRLDHPAPTSFDDFGQSVGISGDTIVVGTPGDDHTGAANSGRVDILVGDWKSWTSQQAYIGIAADDQFGSSVAIYNDLLVVGAPLHDPFGSVDAGYAGIFHRSGTTWTQEGAFVGSAQAGAHYGASVAVGDGAIVLVGAPLDDHSGKTDVGTAEVFLGNGTSWVLDGLLRPSPAVDFAQAGISVDIKGDTAVLGAANDSCYVFTRAGGAWSQQQQITGPAGTQFGSRVALVQSGVLLVGAPAEDHSGFADAGAVYVFTRSGSTWSQQARLTAGAPDADARFGASVALGYDFPRLTAIVGAPGQDSDRGAAYVLRYDGSTWSVQEEVSAATGVAGDAFGTAVAIDYGGGGEFVVGAPDDDHDSRTDAGSAYVLRGSEASYPQHFDTTISADRDQWTNGVISVSSPGQNIFGVFGTDASRMADEASPFPTLDGSERDAYLQFDHINFTISSGALRFGVATDANGDGRVGLANTAEQGPMIQSQLGADQAVFQVIAADDSVHTSSVPGDFSYSNIRLRLVMDLAANRGSGSGSLYWRRTTDDLGSYIQTTPFLAVPGLENIDLKLDAVASDGRNPTLWNAFFVSSPDEVWMDNLTLAESASGYDFDCLPAKDSGIFEPLFEGGWVATPRNTSIRTGVTESLSHDGTSCLAFDQSGPGVGCDQSLVDSPGYWSLPAFDGTERNVTVQFDGTVSFWGNTFGLASDLDFSHHVTLTDTAERGPELVLFSSSGGGVRLRAADGTTTVVPLGNAAGAVGGQWLRVKLEMDLAANGGSGLGNVFAMNLSNGETEFTPVAGLQGMDLRLDRLDVDARDPRLWSGLFSHFEGAGNRLDNIKIRGNAYRLKERARTLPPGAPQDWHP